MTKGLYVTWINDSMKLDCGCTIEQSPAFCNAKFGKRPFIRQLNKCLTLWRAISNNASQAFHYICSLRGHARNNSCSNGAILDLTSDNQRWGGYTIKCELKLIWCRLAKPKWERLTGPVSVKLLNVFSSIQQCVLRNHNRDISHLVCRLSTRPPLKVVVLLLNNQGQCWPVQVWSSNCELLHALSTLFDR